MIEEAAYIEIRGRSLFMLDGLKRITEYGENRITADCGNYRVSVCGKKLTLVFLSDSRISVKGGIDGIEYEGLSDEQGNRENIRPV